MPFGLCNAVSAFSSMMQKVLRPFVDKFVIVFIDDILIYSRNPEEHISHLRTVLSALRQYDLHIKLPKCAFGLPEVEFLGHIVGAEGAKVDPKKTQALCDWPVPKTVHDVRAFLGLAGYYRKFVHRFSHIAAPLTELTRKSSNTSISDQWGPAQQQAFEELKHALTQPPVLIFADPALPYVLYTDSSEFAHGATLLQDRGKGLQPIAYFSHKLSPAERNYGVGELEILAVVRALREYRPYLEGAKFSVYTDHSNLVHSDTQIPPSKRYARWIEYLQQYSADILYVKGSSNLADALSRRPDFFTLATITTSSSPALLDRIRSAYATDPHYSETAFTKKLLFDDNHNLWMHHDRIAIPDNAQLRQDILHECHDVTSCGHLCMSKNQSIQPGTSWFVAITAHTTVPMVRNHNGFCDGSSKIQWV